LPIPDYKLEYKHVSSLYDSEMDKTESHLLNLGKLTIMNHDG
jgi:hypothetical protein